MKTLLIDMDLFTKAAHNGLLLNLIAFHAGREKNTGCYASYETLAQEANKSRDTIQRGVAQLIKDGWIYLAGFRNRCRLIKLTAKTLMVMAGAKQTAEAQENGQEKKQEDTPHTAYVHEVHTAPVHEVHTASMPHRTYSEQTKEHSVCVHSASQKEKIQAPQKTEHTHTVSLSKSKRVTRKKEVSPAVPVPSDVEEVKDYAEKTGGSREQAISFFKYYSSTGWTANGNFIHNWKARFDLWLETDRRKAAEKTASIPLKKAAGSEYMSDEAYSRTLAAIEAEQDIVWGY